MMSAENMKEYRIQFAERFDSSPDFNRGRYHLVRAVGGEEMEVSDGYHTMDELYAHRGALFIALCKQISHQPYGDDQKFKIWRSLKHSAPHDGKELPMFDGWFVMGIGTDKGSQISYHLPISEWEKTNFAETLDYAPNFDGHTAEDVLNRLCDL
jgi:hypothetical protein